jgi:hypothetical protein
MPLKPYNVLSDSGPAGPVDFYWAAGRLAAIGMPDICWCSLNASSSTDKSASLPVPPHVLIAQIRVCQWGCQRDDDGGGEDGGEDAMRVPVRMPVRMLIRVPVSVLVGSASGGEDASQDHQENQTLTFVNLLNLFLKISPKKAKEFVPSFIFYFFYFFCKLF